MIDLSFILPIAKKREDVFTLLQVLTIVDLSFTKMQKTTAAEPFLTNLQSSGPNSQEKENNFAICKSNIEDGHKTTIHSVVNKSIITTNTTTTTEYFRKKTRFK